MFGKIAAFEFRYQMRQPVFWIAIGIFFLFAFGVTTIPQISIGLGPNDLKNGPFALAVGHLTFGLFYFFVITAFVANVVVRDDETGYGPILKSTRINKFDYLMGRFSGAFAAAALAFLAYPLGVLLGSFAPWVDPDKLGPTNLQAYAFAFLALEAPTLLMVSALFFALATVTRSMMWTYVGTIAFVVIYLTANIALDRPEFEKTVALFDPLGLSSYGLVVKYWTTAERNTLVPALEGILLWNRVMVAALGPVFLAVAYALFRFKSVAPSRRKRKSDRLAAAAAGVAPPPSIALGSLPRPRFDAAAAWSQLLARTRLDMGQVFGSPAYAVLLFIGLANSMGGLWFTANEGAYDGAIHPVTRALIPVLEGSFTLIPIIISIYYAGELVWREREKKTHEIVDATPTPDWAYVAPKTLAISLVLLSTLLVSVIAAVLMQVLNGYTRFQFDRYLLWYVLPMAVDITLTAVLAVFLQVLSPHKFIGWGLMVLYLITTFTFANLGWEHNLYNYGGGPRVPLSDMNGMGRFWIGAWWFRIYWSAFALILLVLAYALWRRGTETRLWPRLRRLPRRLRGTAGLVMASALAVFIGTGGFIFYNTNVLNPYRTRIDNEKWQIAAEKALMPYAKTPRPKIVSMKLDVEIYPKDARVVTWGSYIVENRTGQPLKEIHVAFDRDAKVTALTIQQGRPLKALDEFNYRIFALDSPMLPGERRKITFSTERVSRGFPNGRPDTSVVRNGTFLNNFDIAPVLGYEMRGILTDRGKRRQYGGVPVDPPRMARLGDPATLQFNYLRHDADFVNADITVATDADQTPMAPGYMVSESVDGGRRKARFVTEAPVLPFFSVQSARYAVSTENYKGVAISVFYAPDHAWNVERMRKAAEASFDYYQANFSPYQFRQLRFLEFPAFANFAQSFANTVPWSENLGFIADFRDPEKIDMVTYIGAHEIGHQWWAHQIIGADQQGSTLLSETLAQYSALMVMKRMYGEDHIRKFLKFELDSYLRSRGGAVLEEQPLYKVEDQPYIHYRKGSLVMYRLQREIGEDAVNRALRGLLAKFAFRGAPYPNSNDLIAAIRAEAPADKQGLITDLFEKITLYDLKATAMKVTKRKDGRFDVELTVNARKMYADGKGKETDAPLAETIDVGLFTAMPGDKGFDASKVVTMERRAIRTGVQTLRFTVDREPTVGGIDPYNFIIDRNSDDNLYRAGS